MSVVRAALTLCHLTFWPLLITAPAAGQQRSDATADQVAGDDRTTPPGGQVANRRARVEQPSSQITAPRDARRPVDQVQSPVKPGSPTQQVTREARRATGSPQLGKAERSARGAEPLSRRSDGRQTAIVRVGGADRCDPQAPGAGTAACKAVIETRSADFAAPLQPTLSPEQRLLLDRERADTGGVRSAIQRVGRNDIDSNAIDTQALAAITLGQPAPQAPPTKEDLSPESAIDSIIQIINAAQAAAPKS